MTKSQALLLFAGGVVLYNMFSKGHAAGNLNFYPDKVTDFNISGGSPMLKAFVRTQNTSNQSLVLRSMAGNVFVNGSLLGNVENFIPIAIPANGYALIPVVMRLSWISAINTLYDFFLGNRVGSQDIELDAYVNIDGLPQQTVKLVFKIGKA